MSLARSPYFVRNFVAMSSRRRRLRSPRSSSPSIFSPSNCYSTPSSLCLSVISPRNPFSSKITSEREPLDSLPNSCSRSRSLSSSPVFRPLRENFSRRPVNSKIRHAPLGLGMRTPFLRLSSNSSDGRASERANERVARCRHVCCFDNGNYVIHESARTSRALEVEKSLRYGHVYVTIEFPPHVWNSARFNKGDFASSSQSLPRNCEDPSRLCENR